jgi:signal transduction histidine kinase
MSISRLSYFVIGYMILAFLWWEFHLWEQNERLYFQQLVLLEYKYPDESMQQAAEYSKIQASWRSGKRMIVAEGLFFTVCLVFGLWVIRRSADKEVSLARQRRNFLLSITHELKSPIASLRLVIETITRRNLRDDQRDNLLKNGLKDADRLQGLVEELLLAARLEDKWKPDPEDIDLKALVEDCRDAMLTRSPGADISVSAPAGWPSLHADYTGISAVIRNLLENAVKYAPAGTPVRVSVKQRDGKCQIVVADLGPGIPDSEKKRVFEKFYRIGNEETRKSTGTGLGLFIVSQIVKAHNGKIELQDNIPSGAVFTITI